MSIHKEASLAASPEKVYEALTDAAKFAAVTGLHAQIPAGDGASFVLFGGHIEGRQVELVPGQRVVQAWRGSDWDPGVYSLVRFTLIAEGEGTKLLVDHDSYPRGKSPMFPTWHEHLTAGWSTFYLEPFAKYFN